MSTNRTITNAVRKTLREAGMLTAVDGVRTHDDLVRVDGRQVPAHVTRVMLEPLLGGLSAGRIAAVLRAAGFGVYAVVDTPTVPHIEIHTPRETVAEVVTRALVEDDDTTIQALADGFEAATGQPTAYEHADAANGAAEVRTEGDAVELLKPANERRLHALGVVAECSDTFRSRVVPAGGSRFTTASARSLVRMGLLTEHKIPHAGFRLTEQGRRALDAVRAATTAKRRTWRGQHVMTGTLKGPTPKKIFRDARDAEAEADRINSAQDDPAEHVAAYPCRWDDAGVWGAAAVHWHTGRNRALRLAAKGRRCDSPSTRGATGAGNYTDCRGRIDAPGGECPEADGHVRF